MEIEAVVDRKIEATQADRLLRTGNIFTKPEEIAIRSAIEQYDEQISDLKQKPNQTESIVRQITLKTAKKDALTAILTYQDKTLNELFQHLLSYSPDSDVMQGSKTPKIIEKLRHRCREAALLSFNPYFLQKIIEGYEALAGRTGSEVNVNDLDFDDLGEAFGVVEVNYLQEDENPHTVYLLKLMRDLLQSIKQGDESIQKLFEAHDDPHEKQLKTLNVAIDVYLGTPTNQWQHLYGLLRLFKKAAPSKNHFFEGAYKLGRSMNEFGPQPSEKLPLDQLAVAGERGNNPIIAGISAWQLQSLFHPREKNEILLAVYKAYGAKKNKYFQSDESQALSIQLSELNDSQTTNEWKTKVEIHWSALIRYCNNSQNHTKKFYEIFVAELNKNLSERCVKAYNEACRLIKNSAPGGEGSEGFYCKAIAGLTAIPTHEQGADSPLGRAAIFAALSEAHQRLGNYPLAMQLYEMAHVQGTRAKEQKQAWGKLGVARYTTYFPEGMGESRKSQLHAELVTKTDSHHHFAVRADSVARYRWALFGRPAENAAITKTVLALSAVEKGALIVSFFFPPAAFVTIPLALTASSLGYGLLGLCALHSGGHALTRHPLDEGALVKLGEHLDHLTKREDADDAIKVFLIAKIKEEYERTKTKASSDASQGLLAILKSEVAATQKWQKLHLYMSDNKNNGKRLYCLIRDELALQLIRPILEQPESAIFGPSIKAGLIADIVRVYDKTKSNVVSAESKTLLAHLRSNDQSLDSQWKALCAYISEPTNKGKRLYDICRDKLAEKVILESSQRQQLALDDAESFDSPTL
jgi:hypothetical protein